MTNSILTAKFPSGVEQTFPITWIGHRVIESPLLVNTIYNGPNSLSSKYGGNPTLWAAPDSNPKMPIDFHYINDVITPSKLAFTIKTVNPKLAFSADIGTNVKCVIWSGNNIYSVRSFIEHLVTELPIITGQVEIDTSKFVDYFGIPINPPPDFEVGDMIYADERFINLEYDHTRRFNDHSKVQFTYLKETDYVVI